MITGTNPLNIKGDKGNTPLHLAAAKSQPEMVQILLDAGASPNIQNDHDETPLHLAVTNQNIECVQALLNAGALTDVRDHDFRNYEPNNTPLHLAVHLKNVVIVQALLTAGATMIHDNNRNTPLHYALINELTEIAQILIQSITASHNFKAEPSSQNETTLEVSTTETIDTPFAQSTLEPEANSENGVNLEHILRSGKVYISTPLSGEENTNAIDSGQTEETRLKNRM